MPAYIKPAPSSHQKKSDKYYHNFDYQLSIILNNSKIRESGRVKIGIKPFSPLTLTESRDEYLKTERLKAQQDMMKLLRELGYQCSIEDPHDKCKLVIWWDV